MNNNPFATHLRGLVRDSLVTLLDKGVPNAIPPYGLIVAIIVKEDLLRSIPKAWRKDWTQVGNAAGQRMYHVPAWSLLWLADEIERQDASSGS